MNCFSKLSSYDDDVHGKSFLRISKARWPSNQYRPIKESFQAEESVNFEGEIMIPCAQWFRLSDAVQKGIEEDVKNRCELTKLINWFEAGCSRFNESPLLKFFNLITNINVMKHI